MNLPGKGYTQCVSYRWARMYTNLLRMSSMSLRRHLKMFGPTRS